MSENAQRLLEQYAKLNDEEKALVRAELLAQAEMRVRGNKSSGANGSANGSTYRATNGAVKVSRRAADHIPSGSRVTPTTEFTPLTDSLVNYFISCKNAWSHYIPTDRYRPGDEDRLDLFRKDTLDAIEPLEWLLKTYFRYEAIGMENVPQQGRAIIISNHGLLPIDGMFLNFEIMRHTGRWVRGLTDWRIYKMPLLRQFFMDMGIVVGTHENGDRLLNNEEMIFIMPGGSKEAWKSSKFRYRLLWDGRYGFIKMALRNQAPIIPSANVGTDDTYHVFFDGYTTAYKVFRSKKVLLPISLPIGLGVLPMPVKMKQYIGEPIYLPYPPEAADDQEVVKECQRLVKGRVYELIDRGLREREETMLNRFI